MSTIASGVAVSEASTPKLPVATTRTAAPTAPRRSPCARAGRRSRRSRRAPRPPGSGSRARSRSSPTRRTASSSAARASGCVDPAGLEPQQGRHGLQVVLHPVVDLADRRVLGDQLAVAAAQVGDVAQQHQRADPLPRRAQRDAAQDEADLVGARPRCPGAPGPPSTTLRVSSSGRRRGGTRSRVTSAKLSPAAAADQRHHPGPGLARHPGRPGHARARRRPPRRIP